MFDAALLRASRDADVTARARRVDLVLTVTSGRSGTKLLTALCREVLGLDAEHEPAPRANFAMRPALQDPDTALRWWVEDKLPVVAHHVGHTYVETSHLYCKGLLEPLLALGVRPRLVMLRRPAEQVAASLLQLDVVPGRTPDGDLVLLRPDDPGVLPLPGWRDLEDYALCYWYALEIERRQAMYSGVAAQLGMRTHQLDMRDLLTRRGVLRLAMFLGPSALLTATRRGEQYAAVTAVNQNTRAAAGSGRTDRPLPPAEVRRDLEQDVRLRTGPYSALALQPHDPGPRRSA